MEDITGFDDQIGAKKVVKKIKRFVSPTSAIKKAAAMPKRAVVVRPSASPIKRAAAMPKRAVVVRPSASPIKRAAAMPQRAVVRPGASPIKRAAAMPQRAAVVRPSASPIKRAAAMPQRAVVRPSVQPTQRKFSTAQVPYKKVQQAVRKQQATAVVKRAEATRQPIPVRALTQVTAPAAVKNASAVQRSYMPVDLPYQTAQVKRTAIRIPATNFALPTDIDLVQPPVDAGISDYYGK